MQREDLDIHLTEIEVRIKSPNLLKEKNPIINGFKLTDELITGCETFDGILDAVLLKTRHEIIKFMKKAKILDQKGRWIKK